MILRDPNAQAELKCERDVEKIKQENKNDAAQEHGNRAKNPQEQRERKVECSKPQ